MHNNFLHPSVSNIFYNGKNTSFLFLLLLLTACNSTKSTTGKAQQAQEKLAIVAHLSDCHPNEPLALYQFDGVGFKKLESAKIIGQDSFVFEILQTTQPTFYYIGQNSQQKMPLIAGTETALSLNGSCANLRNSTTFNNSPLNEEYGNVIKDISDFSSKRRRLGQEFAKTRSQPEQLKKTIDKMAALDQEQINWLEQLQINHPYLGRVAALTVYPSFQNNKGNYENEINYFADNYFQYADLKHQDYDQIPYTFEAAKNYATVLSMQAIPETSFHQYLDSLLVKFNGEGKAYKYALGGIAIGLQSKNHPSFVRYGDLFLEKYGAEDSDMIRNFRTAVNKAKSFMTGAEAPDFTQKDPDGRDISLSDFKGKVVLIDFWASWCGPCRRENPNVVKMYNHFKDKGFEILGVSLDKKMEPWLRAIEKDGLTWPQVSDLKGWKNEVAQLYSVTSVPHTVLLDREGRIVARNLRGPQLEAKVAQVLAKQ